MILYRNNNPLKSLAMLTLQVILFASCQKEEIKPIPKSDALFIYMIADNDLDFYATSNINEMEEFVANKPNTGSIYVYIDRAKNRKTAHPILYQISADTTAKINSKILKVYPENNSADDIVFQNILEDVITISTKENEYIKGLILWSHGSAWLPHSSLLTSHRATAVKSFGLDQTAPNGSSIHSEMDIKKLASALNKYHFEFLLFDACFMGSIEVFYELKNNFDYIIASPTEVLASGFPYKEILGDMLSNPVNYKNISEKYVSFFQQKKGFLQSASVITIKTEELYHFANIFKKYLSKKKDKIDTKQWLQYDQENTDYLFDLGDFIDSLEKEEPKKELSNQLEKLIVKYNHTKYFFNKIPLEKSSGISIFAPKKTNTKNNEYDFYKDLSWSNAVNMPNFIDN